MHLPDISVRAKEARQERLNLFRDLGLIKKKEDSNENNTEGSDT